MKKFLIIPIVLLSIALLTKAAFSIDPLFNNRVDYDPGRGPIQVISVDIDGDNDLDLVIVNSVVSLNDRSVAILINNGDGSFIEPAEEDKYPMNCPKGICSGDFDGDGDIDLAVGDVDICWSDGSGRIVILENNGAGDFSYGLEIPIEGDPNGMAANDLNDDGRLDIMVSLRLKHSMAVIMNSGDGGFDVPVLYPSGTYPDVIASADLNSDGYPDIAVTNWDQETGSILVDSVTILMNGGAGEFGAPVNYAAGYCPQGILAQDFDADGHFDLAVANHHSDFVSILFNTGDGSFSPAVNYVAGDAPHDFSSADYDGNGTFDLAVTNTASDNISILLNDGNGIFAPPDNYPVGGSPVYVCTADFDGDCDLDLAVANYLSGSISILHNQSSQDIDGDGVDDVCDNCPYDWNPDQADSDDDGIGDACEREQICSAFLTPKHVAIHNSGLLKTAPRGEENHNWDRHSFKVHLLPCEPMDVSVGDSAEVFVDVDASGTFDEDEQYPAVVSSTDEDGEATDIAIKVFVGRDLIDNDPLVAIYSVGVLNIADAEGNEIDYLQLDTFTPGGFAAEGSGSPEIGNFPNPFNPSTTISFSLSTASDVKLEIYNILGERVTVLIDETLGAGEHAYPWYARDSWGQPVASGIYFYRFMVGNQVETKKMVLMR